MPTGRRRRRSAVTDGRDGQTGQGSLGCVDGGEVGVDDGPAPLPVRAADGRPNRLECDVEGQQVREREAAHLHHDVDLTGQSGIPRDPMGVDHMDVQVLLQDGLLDLAGQGGPTSSPAGRGC